MSKEKLIPYFDYFDEYTVDSWSYSGFIRCALDKRLLPSDPIKVYNYKYKKCLDFIEQNYDPLKRSKAISLKGSFKLDKKMEKNWLVNLIELAKNEETAEHEYHASLNEDVRKEKMAYSSYLLESRKSKHQIDGVEEVTSTKRRKDLTNVSLDDSRSNTTNVAYSGKKLDDRSILESADSKMNQVNNNLHSVPSSNVNREEDIDPEYYDVKKRAKILYSWEDSINKIDFKDTSKKDWILGSYNLSSEFRNFQQSTIQQVKEKPYLCYKKDTQKILCLSNIMLIESIKPTYLTCNHEIWNEVCQRQTYPRLSSVINSIILEYSLLLNSFTPLDKIQEKWCGNFSRIAELNNKEDKDDFCKCQIILRNFLLLNSINNDNEDTFVHDILHDIIKEIFRDSMFELVWANSESSVSNKENTIKCKKPDFKLMNNKGDEILFGEVKPKDSLSISAKKDLVKLANFQTDALNDLIKKYGNKIGMISFGIWVCGARIRIYEMDLNYDGIYRMILIANIITPTEHAQFLNLVTVLEAFYNIKHRISEVLTIIASNTTPNSPSRSTYGRVSTPSPKPVRITISGIQPN